MTDHSAPIYGRPIEEGKLYRDRTREVWKCTAVGVVGDLVSVQSEKTGWKDTVYLFGNVHIHCTSDRDLIEEYKPVTWWGAVHKDGHVCTVFSDRVRAENYAYGAFVTKIIELQEVVPHPVKVAK
jgi:hypothetical protein